MQLFTIPVWKGIGVTTATELVAELAVVALVTVVIVVIAVTVARVVFADVAMEELLDSADFTQ